MSSVKYTLSSLYGHGGRPVVSGDESYVDRILGHEIDRQLYDELL